MRIVKKIVRYAIRRTNEEPALAAGLAQAVLATAVAFGLNLTDEQVAVLLGLSAAILAFAVRKRVSPVAKG